jgi:hypothetical protein
MTIDHLRVRYDAGIVVTDHVFMNFSAAAVNGTPVARRALLLS